MITSDNPQHAQLIEQLNGAFAPNSISYFSNMLRWGWRGLWTVGVIALIVAPTDLFYTIGSVLLVAAWIMLLVNSTVSAPLWAVGQLETDAEVETFVQLRGELCAQDPSLEAIFDHINSHIEQNDGRGLNAVVGILQDYQRSLVTIEIENAQDSHNKGWVHRFFRI